MSVQEREGCEPPSGLATTDKGGLQAVWQHGWIDFETRRSEDDGTKLQVWRCNLCPSGFGMSAFRQVRYAKSGKSKVYDTVKQHFIHIHDPGGVYGERDYQITSKK